MKKFLPVLLFFAVLITGFIPAKAQPNFPGDDVIYRDDLVPRIDITINPDTLVWLYQEENLESDIEWHATFVFSDGSISDTIDDIGFRLRGNTSRYSAKKSFKVSFNTYESGRTYHGVEKMNLNGEHNDPTISRSKLCWDLCRQLRIPAPRSNHVRVYINGNYYGLYMNVEHIDENFVASRFGNQDGNLYKCLYPADLNYLGENPDLYKYESGDRRAYELKTNESSDDYGDLAHFIDVLNNTPIDDLECEIEKVFNVQDYMKVAAMDVFTGDWDGYIYNKNNYYLYHNSQSGKFEYIPYDLDNTYGVDWFGIDWAQRNIYNWQHPNEYRPLFERLMQVQKFRDWFSWYLSQLISHSNNQVYFDGLDEMKTMIYPYVPDDPFYPLDYGYTVSDFNSAWNNFNRDHVKYGLKAYISARSASAQSQLVLNNVQPVLNYLNVRHGGPSEVITFGVFVFDDDANPSVELQYNINQGGWENLTMQEQTANEYTAQLMAPDGTSNILYRIVAEDSNGNTNTYPCEVGEISISPGGEFPLFINEFLAGNDNGITDEAGEHEDWLEVYNGGSQPVWLGDKYLSDNLSNPGKWAFPDYTMQPGEFLLVWCDEDQEQGLFHTNFKISKSGEELGIFDNESTGYAIIDTVVFGPQEDDISYGRYPDGGSEWKFYEDPTPGISNMQSAVNELTAGNRGFYAYPNPAANGQVHLNKTVSFELFTQTGRRIGKYEKTAQFCIDNLPPGIYLIRTGAGEIFKLIKP